MGAKTHELGPFRPVSDSLILVAVQRAQCHGRKQVPPWHVAEHLGFVHSSAATRRLRPRLEALRIAGALERTREHGRYLWGLSATGRRRLSAAQRKGKVEELPESPQHRRWRHAQEDATRRIEDFLGLASLILDDAYTAAYATQVASSEVWFELSKRLGAALWLVGSAAYCRDEWPEPDDGGPDEDGEVGGERSGRRDVNEWNAKESIAKGGSE